jgi:mannan endo-1,4-beta-mannosidase
MKVRLALAGATFLGLLVSMVVFVPPAHAAVGIRVSNGRLVEANGSALVLRGINHPHTWFKTQTSSFANIKAAGANAVRVVLSGGRWQPADTASDVANVINLCKTNRLICVLENHDTTGFNEQGGAISLDQSVNYWISVQSALTGQENYVILDIGNEPFGNGSNPNSTTWPTATSAAIQRLRNAGFQHTIMVDAPNWGQDWNFVMRDNAPSVLAADTTGNTIFSVHMYGVYDTAAEVTSYINSFTSRGLALCVCEFGFNHSDGNPDEDTIMSATQAAGIGNMAWSWSGNGSPVEYLDLVIGFNPAQRSSWGTRYITGANGLSTTSREATIYSGQQDITPPSTPGTPASSNVGTTTASLTWAASTDTGGSGLAGYNVYREQGATDPILASPTTNSANLTNLTPNTQYQVYIRARDGAGNLSNPSATTTFMTQQSVDPTPPTAPTNLAAGTPTSTSVNLTWTASTDNVGVTGYDILRAPGATGGTFAVVGTSTTTSFNAGSLTAATTYRFQVRARDAAGNLSPVSNTVQITTAPGGTGGCSVTPTLQTQWPTGYVFEPTTVRNTGSATITTWTVTFTLPAGHAITGSWNGVFTINGQTITVKPVGFNATLPPNGTGAFGFQVSRPNGNTALATGFACTSP